MILLNAMVSITGSSISFGEHGLSLNKFNNIPIIKYLIWRI